METDPLDAQAALDAVASAERRSAEIATYTPWYAPWYGASCALFSVAIAFLAADLAAVGIGVISVGLASLSALVTMYQRATGVWPSTRGMTWHFVAAIVAMFGSGILNYLVARTYGVGWWVAVFALVTAVLMALLSRGYDAALVRKTVAR